VTLFAMAMFADRARDDSEMMRILGGIGMMANRWFLPSSLLTLVFGFVAVLFGGLWSELWVILGLVGFAATFLTGHFVLRVKAMEAGKLMGEGKIAEAAIVGRRLMQVARFDYVVLFTVVADMVFRPSWTDFATLGVLAVALGAGAYFFLGAGLRPTQVQAA